MEKKEILGISKITYKYQITIPKKVRTKYNLDEGDAIMFVEEGNRLYFKPSIES